MTLRKSKDKKESESQLERAESLLTRFGLSESESKVYVYLLERGVPVGGSKISIGANLHRQYIYLALPKLLALGLVEEVPHGKLSKYVARAPKEIEKIAKKRLFEAEETVKELEKFSKVGHEQDFEVFVGARAIQSYETDWVKNVEEHQEQYIIGGNTKGFAEMMGESLDEYLIGESRRKITTYYLGHTSELGLWQASVLSKNDLKAKFIDQLPQGVSHFVIRKDMVAFFSFLNPPLLYVIKSAVVAQNYKDFFMMLWNMAEGRELKV
jgi:sugar-specific transcriptional regulator TrmB